MKVLSTEGLTKLIQLIKSAFISVDDVETTTEVTLADVALSGDYDDLINKPSIPTATSDLTNDSGYITSLALAPYALDTNVVHKTGDETILGEKTFQTYLLLKKSSDDFSITPQNPIYTEIRNTDVNDKEIGQFRVWKDTDGANVIDLLGRYQDSSVNVYGATLGIKTYSDGRSFTYASANDENNSIVTTVNKSKARNGYFQLGNGLIIQWGEGTIAANATSANVTFPRAFTSSTSYTFMVQHVGGSNTGGITTHAQATTTGIKINYSQSYSGIRAFDWIAIGY